MNKIKSYILKKKSYRLCDGVMQWFYYTYDGMALPLKEIDKKEVCKFSSKKEAYDYRNFWCIKDFKVVAVS